MYLHRSCSAKHILEIQPRTEVSMCIQVTAEQTFQKRGEELHYFSFIS
ncbi:hypothetical protein OESDEN_09302 [Oesophagostomum dentatum]|uniref:Uncharacterized protein n=1 Tax=Oesophagostomum dentatum TaxID=61180 RepID=A0A0B1SZX6_OESDE|nr:hypothetical protein OESDEN_09302 [Oesophagostomum dentatum]